ncbi:hypothetical protein CALCODRAFT_522062 [Calocera cornea HHB12733]|uniref:Uncharacterized protein n=1 Tax=Calocera cornea HHB12733 TaxID=1353952 RepID=A0A165C4G6_9BASI|nr:hypothetical protein CALCODRAFT_522062 [Calocera cornea HHB12733]
MSINSFLLERFGYLKVADVLISGPGLPFHQAIPRHIYEEQRKNGAISDKDEEVLFRTTARPAWLYAVIGIGIGLAARRYTRRSLNPLSTGVMYSAPTAGILVPIFIELRTKYMLEDPQRVADALGRMRLESLHWWIDVRRELPGEFARAVERVGAARAEDMRGVKTVGIKIL